MSKTSISPLRRRLIEDMTVRNFVEKTRHDYIRHVRTFTAFLGRSPDSATPDDLRRFPLHQTETGLRPPAAARPTARPRPSAPLPGRPSPRRASPRRPSTALWRRPAPYSSVRHRL